MILFRSTSEWADLARAIQFEPHDPVAGYGSHVSFRSLKRALGPVVGPPPRWAHWLYGRRNGRESMVLRYETGSGSRRHTWTAFVARIDPPLFLGTSISKENFLTEMFGGQDVILGIPQFDPELRLGAFDPDRLRTLLWPQNDLQLLQALVRYTRDGLHVTDSTAVFQLSGIHTNPDGITRLLDQAGWIAAELERRRMMLPETPQERSLREEWQAYADAMHLSFDPTRMKIEGEISGTNIEVALETNGARVQTAVTVKWPRSIGIQVRLYKANGLSFLTALFIQDIKTGDPIFDDMFVIQGFPEQHVRQVFANDALRMTLRSLAPHATEVTLDHAGAFWLWPGAALSRSDLDGHVTPAMRASQALFGTTESLGPYR